MTIAGIELTKSRFGSSAVVHPEPHPDFPFFKQFKLVSFDPSHAAAMEFCTVLFITY
jgi:hypothetical protein